MAESDADLALPKYATGIGLVLYGIEKEEARMVANAAKNASSPDTEKEAEPLSKPSANGKEQSIIDILNNMPGTKEQSEVPPVQNPEPEPIKVEQPVPTPVVNEEKKDKNEKTKPTFFGKIAEYMWKIVGDDDVK